MATKKGAPKGGVNSKRWGPEGAVAPTRAQLTSIIMETYPDLRSGLRYDSIALRIGALYNKQALKAHPARDVSYSGRDEITREYAACMMAIPDMSIEKGEPRFLKDGSVEVNWVLTGTHTGPFRGVPPSGQPVRIEGTERFVFQGTEIVRHDVWTNYDTLGWNGIIVGSPPPEEPLFPEKESGTP